MNLKMTGPSSSLAVFLACLALLATAVNADDSRFCIPGLVKGYTMDGLSSPTRMKLDMCPLIEYSCCEETDQAVFFKNWFFAGDYTYLKEKFDNDLKVYTELLEEAVRVQDLARKVQSNMSDRLLSNCKVLARRITHFDIREVTPKLKEIIKNFHKFIETTYSGFYCSLCNADYHKYIMLDAKQVVFSKRFCRDIVTNSLHYLLYFHVHLINYINLQIKFLSFCDGSGKFYEQPIDDLLYQISPHKKMLLECRDERNEKTWFTQCLNICSRFSMVELRDFFRPNILQFKETTLTLTELRKKMRASLKRRTLIDSVKMTGRRRVLVEQGAADGQTTEKEQALQAEEERKRLEREKRLRDPTVFQSEEANIPIEKFRIVFEDFGLDYADSGREVKFDADLAKKLDQIRTKGNAAGDQEDDTAYPGMGIEDFSSSSSNFTHLIMAMMTLLTMGLLI